jgi:putative membrane protein
VWKARERPAASVRVGYAEGPVGKAREGIGSQGLQVLAVETDAVRVAYFLFDGNNMIPGLRDEILLAARGIVDDAEVLTTDNHSVNARMGGYNPIGMYIDRERIVAAARDGVREAIADLRPVESLAASGTIHGLRVFGHENTARLTMSVNATIRGLRPTAILTLGFALAVSLVLLALIR